MKPEEVQKADAPAEQGIGCGMTGPGSRLRVGLLIALAVVVVVLLIWGFSSAG